RLAGRVSDGRRAAERRAKKPLLCQEKGSREGREAMGETRAFSSLDGLERCDSEVGLKRLLWQGPSAGAHHPRLGSALRFVVTDGQGRGMGRLRSQGRSVAGR